MSDVFEGALVKSVSIDNMLNQRNAVVEKIVAALDLLTEARDLAGAAGVGFPRFKIDEHRYAVYNMLDPESRGDAEKNIRLCIDSAGWAYLMNESGLRSLMDAKARSKWDESLQKGEFPELTKRNIEATFTNLHDSRGEMFERGVIEVFRHLSWDYKTNNPFRFGKRIIIRNLRNQVTGGRSDSYGYLNHRATDELDDLVRVFRVLEGEPEPDHRDSMWSRISKQERAEYRVGDENELQADYFHIRWFKNGNGHLTFSRADLVEKMNGILTKHYPGALPHDKNAMAA